MGQYHGIPPISWPSSMGEKDDQPSNVGGSYCQTKYVQCSLKFLEEKKNCTNIIIYHSAPWFHQFIPQVSRKSRTGHCFRTTSFSLQSNQEPLKLPMPRVAIKKHLDCDPSKNPQTSQSPPHLRLLRGDLLCVALHPLRSRLCGRRLRGLRGGGLGGLKGLEGWATKIGESRNNNE